MTHYYQYTTAVWYLIKGLGCQCCFYDAADSHCFTQRNSAVSQRTALEADRSAETSSPDVPSVRSQCRDEILLLPPGRDQFTAYSS